jgi:hypothetical protein
MLPGAEAQMTEIKPKEAPDERVISLVPLSITPEENGEWYVGAPSSGEFVSLPAEGVYLIEQLQSGASLQAIHTSFAERYGQPPELDEFIDDLVSLGFVRAVNGEPVQPEGSRSRGIALLGSLTAAQCRWLLSRPITALAVTVWLAFPSLLLLGHHVPAATDVVLFGNNLFAVFLLFVPLGWLMVCIHELSHSLTARALGCPAYTRFGNRLWYFVCETDLSSIYSLPRRQRYRPLLAGMTTDLLFLDLALVARHTSIFERPARVVAFMLFANFTYQVMIFLRTDLYYVFTTATRLDNLIPMARQEVNRFVGRLTGRQLPWTVDDTELTAGRRTIVRLYLLACAGGIALGAYTIGLLIIPANIRVLSAAISAVRAGPSFDFGSAIFILLFIPTIYTTMGWTFVRNYRERRLG